MSIAEASNGLPSSPLVHMSMAPRKVPVKPAFPQTQPQPPTVMAQSGKMQIQPWEGTSTGIEDDVLGRYIGTDPGKKDGSV